MPIFTKDNINVFYIHVPKTGGTYIEHFFKKNGFSISEFDVKQNKLRKCTPQHMHAEQINHLYNIKEFDYVFMTVRNPVFRFRSEFIMRHQNFNQKTDLLEKYKDINIWWKIVKRNFEKNPFAHDNHIRPQFEFYINGIDVFKQEEGYDEQWAQTLESKIGIKFDVLTIPRKKHAEKDYGDDIKKLILNDDVFEDIKKLYQKDYAIFDYSPSITW
jgi:hypothetical protein